MTNDRITQLRSGKREQLLSLADTSLIDNKPLDRSPAGKESSNSPDFNNTSFSSPDLREALYTPSQHYPENLKSLSSFDRLSAAQKEQVTRIFNRLDGNLSTLEKRELINALLSRKDHSGELIITSQFKGDSLLEHLDALASKSLHHKLAASGVSNENVLTSLVQDVVNASHIDQGKRATCTVTSLQWEMCLFDPARYVGISSKLSTEGGLQLQRGYLGIGDYVHNDKRSASSIIFQNSLMAAASDRGYHAESDTVSSTNGEHKGLYCRQVEGVYELAWEKPLTAVFNDGIAMKKRLDELPLVVASISDLRSGKASLPAPTIAFTACISGLGRKEHANHVTSACHRIEDPETGKSYYCFRNPWGKSQLKDGQGGAILIDSQNSIYALPEDEFLRRTSYIMVSGGAFGTTPEPTGQPQEKPAIFFTSDLPLEEEQAQQIEPQAKILSPTESPNDKIEIFDERRVTERNESLDWKNAAAHEESSKKQNKRRRNYTPNTVEDDPFNWE